MQLATVQINATTMKVFAVVTPPVQAVTPPNAYWVVVDLDAIPDPSGKTHDPKTGTFS